MDARIRIRRKDVIAFQVTNDVKVVESRVRQMYFYPEVFSLTAHVVIDEKEIAQASNDLLDEKFQDALEQIMVREDLILKTMLDQSIKVYNDVISFSTFNPQVFTLLRTAVRSTGNPAATMLMAFDIWDDIIADPDFVSWWD
jgi:hypothetical protein